MVFAGTFDDCQAVVKEMFTDPAARREFNLAAVNSINWARIVAQIVYYFTTYAQWLQRRRTASNTPSRSSSVGNLSNCRGDASERRGPKSAQSVGDLPEVNFVVPTGNFGNALAAWYAKRMGLPVRRIVVATNTNDVLYRYGDSTNMLSPILSVWIHHSIGQACWQI